MLFLDLTRVPLWSFFLCVRFFDHIWKFSTQRCVEFNLTRVPEAVVQQNFTGFGPDFEVFKTPKIANFGD